VYQDAKEAKGVLLVSRQVDDEDYRLALTFTFARRRFSVPHDRLFLDALERDLKREKEGMATTTEIIGEPARSFRSVPAQRSVEALNAEARTLIIQVGSYQDSVRAVCCVRLVRHQLYQ
jgi:hypothetical protein